MFEIRGCFYGKVEYAIPASDGWYSKDDKVWNTISRIRQTASTVYGSSALTGREFWRFIVLDLYERDGGVVARIERDQDARNNFDADMEALTLRGSKPLRLHSIASNALHQKYFCTTTEGDMALIQGPAKVGDDIYSAWSYATLCS